MKTLFFAALLLLGGINSAEACSRVISPEELAKETAELKLQCKAGGGHWLEPGEGRVAMPPYKPPVYEQKQLEYNPADSADTRKQKIEAWQKQDKANQEAFRRIYEEYSTKYNAENWARMMKPLPGDSCEDLFAKETKKKIINTCSARACECPKNSCYARGEKQCIEYEIWKAGRNPSEKGIFQ